MTALLDLIRQTAEDLFGDGAEGLGPYCAAAAETLSARLPEGKTPEECRGAFLTAAAMLALAMKTDAEAAAGGGSYTAGSVTVRAGGSGNGASARLRAQAEALLAPYCADGDFAFVGVRGS